jgi:hypothetical protein
VYLVYHTHWDNFGKVNFQVFKLLKSYKKHFDVIFIGDSSGGYSIKTDHKRSINLCLSASFGYEGNREFLKIIDQFITYDTIVVINTLDISAAPVSEKGVWLPNIYSNDMLSRCNALQKSFTFISLVVPDAIQNKCYIDSQFNASIDFRTVKSKTTAKRNIFDTAINLAKVQQLVALESDIKRKKIPYYLCFGPSLPYDEAYYKRLVSVFVANNIHHQFNRPLPLDSTNVGSSPNHIHPSYSHVATQYFFDLIRKGEMQSK